MFLLPLLLRGQESTPAPVPKPVPATFFSGSVVAISETEITVRRRALVSNATTETFRMDAETKIEGRLRVKATVTVRYVKEEDGHLKALGIIVR
jgi:hypothetical protein